MGLPEMILRGMPTSSRFVGKLQSRDNWLDPYSEVNNEDSDEEISNAKRHPGYLLLPLHRKVHIRSLQREQRTKQHTH
ncbi:Uncharacterized protein FKW44_022998 [Caligus rogercresseyi]|uniref:Uncharacterized protein n=1 Tax=Caligus rogercresseyi TaxID=217165 RepID=A0A7T8GNW6_CALRO|nr:Uncharacterized protein FKW44_022998 [Caligus rogercresseyi]